MSESSEFGALMNAHISAIEEYTPIQPLDVLSRRLGLPVEDLVKLDANENPYGPVAAVREALANFEHYHIYPDPQCESLRGALAEFTGVDAAHILTGHGADELLDLISRLFLAPGDAIVNTPPTFGMYSFDARLQGAQVIEVPRHADYRVDVTGIKAAIDDSTASVKLIYVTSPNNPSGNLLGDAELNTLLALPAMVVLDEAYIEFAGQPSRAARVAQHDNLIVLRTFSKAAGIAGLRLGYGIFPSWLMPTLWKFKQPYNVNVAAAVAGAAALGDVQQIEAVVERLRSERERLYTLLEDEPRLRAVPDSQANFILCHVDGEDAKSLKLALEEMGVLVRHYAKPGLENCIRISVGRPTDTDRLMAALAKTRHPTAR
ncbi:MAG: histidinol-phosphate transaminase [Pseudomonadota bacterium]